jgi:hypothetical protein
MIWLMVSLGALATPSSASLLQGPTPVNWTSWPSQSGMPPDLLKGGTNAWTIRARLTVRPDGTLQGCEVESGTDNRALDKFTCEMFERRARFRPAVWADGSPSYGLFRFTFQWARAVPPSSKPPHVDLKVRVDRKAYAERVPAFVRVVFAVDEDGQIRDCSGAAPFDSAIATNPPTLVPIACEAVIHRYVPRAAKDKLGKPVRSVQNAVVRIKGE